MSCVAASPEIYHAWSTRAGRHMFKRVGATLTLKHCCLFWGCGDMTSQQTRAAGDLLLHLQFKPLCSSLHNGI
eukprot:5521698-Pyramimonas_sp.AAC.1